jgi:hypothetical protein
LEWFWTKVDFILKNKEKLIALYPVRGVKFRQGPQAKRKGDHAGTEAETGYGIFYYVKKGNAI